MPTLPPSIQPMEHDDDLDARAHDPDRPAGAAVQAGHEAVARAGAEVGADVEAGRDGEQQQAGDEDQDARPRAAGRPG